MESSDVIPVKTLFTGTIEALAALVKYSDGREQAALKRAIQTLRSSQPRAEKLIGTFPQDQERPRLAAGIVEPESSEKRTLKAWGADLVQRREAAGMTREVLAQRAGFSESTLRNVEKGIRPPTRRTIMHLQSVPELRIDADAISGHLAGKEAKGRGFAPNCWLAPEYDAMRLHAEMTMQLNGRGGHIEQTYLYLDPTSAAAWCAIAEQESYTQVRTSMPLGRVAERIGECAGSVGLDVIGLGCGDGNDEVRLTQCLIEQNPDLNLRLYLLDISQPLCSSAYRHAARVLSGRANVSVCAIQGNFHNLQRYTQLLHTEQRSHRRRVVCMFGNTFANLQNEILFARNSLIGFAPGDFLLLHVCAAQAPADQPELILKQDSGFSSGQVVVRNISAPAAVEEFFVGLLRRHVQGFKSVELRSVLDFEGCPVPGSYASDVRALVRTVTSEPKEFSVMYRKRYDREQLDHKMRREGWDAVAHWLCAEEHFPYHLLLYRRSRHLANGT